MINSSIYTATMMKFVSVLMFCFAGLSASECPACQAGWVSSGAGSCYEFNESVKSWDDARADCHSKGAELAQVTTLAKAAHLRSTRYYIGRSGRCIYHGVTIGNQNNYYWIGAVQNSAGSRDFSWVSGGAFSTSLWYPGEPNQLYSGELCVDMCELLLDMKMCDWPCSRSLGYICEKWLY